MIRLSCLRCGFLGAFALLVMTLIGAPFKVAIHVLRYGWADMSWHEFLVVLLFVAAAGFACGVFGWLLTRLTDKFGALGDPLAGIAVMVVFFFLCMLAYDRQLLLNPAEALPLWIVAIVVGIVGGFWLGHDLRKIANEQRDNTDGASSGRDSDAT